MSVLIDSDHIIDFLKGERSAIRLMGDHWADGIAMSIMSYAEVYEGILFGKEPDRHARSFERLVRQLHIIPLGRQIARQYAYLRGHLRSTGLTIAQPDLIIAATAIEYELPLATRNVRHFGRVPGLVLL